MSNIALEIDVQLPLILKCVVAADAISSMPDKLNKSCVSDPVACGVIYWVMGFFWCIRGCVWSKHACCTLQLGQDGTRMPLLSWATVSG